MANWYTEHARTRAPRQAKLVVKGTTPCHFCTHYRTSHSEIVLTAKCRVTGCDCPVFDPICGCGHLLSEHQWGTPPNPWECAGCKCLKFGAALTDTVERKPFTEVASTRPPVPPAPKPDPEVASTTMPDGTYLRWGRRDLPLYDCASGHCPELATYWTTRAYSAKSGKWVTVKRPFCGRHFRQWAWHYLPPTQLSLFG